ncbi:MAG: hypothetical protein ABI397_03505 [Candidatus Saccharimonas sp.]
MYGKETTLAMTGVGAGAYFGWAVALIVAGALLLLVAGKYKAQKRRRTSLGM